MTLLSTNAAPATAAHCFKVAVLGTGAMGSRMAQNLIKAGHQVTVWSRSPESARALQAQGAALGTSPRDAVRDADFVISMLHGDDASRQVWTDDSAGALAGMRPDAVALDSSTLTPAWTRELAQLFAARDTHFLEAPVAGSRPQADAAQLIFFVGGDASVLAQAEPVLKALGSAIHHTGPVGSAAVLKLMVNAMLGVQLAALAELLGMAQKAGIDTGKLLEIFSATPVASPAAKFAGGAMLAGNFAPLFPLALVDKDFGYLLQTADAAGAELPVSSSVKAVVRRAVDAGLQGSNITALAKLYLSLNAAQT